MHSCKLVSDVAVISGDKILLVKYKDGNKYDHQSGWFLPDDLLKDYEDPDDSAKRILSEQLNIAGAEVKIAFLESFRGNDKSWHIVFHYKTALPSGSEVIPSVDVESCEWFDLKELPGEKDIAHHGWALSTIKEITK